MADILEEALIELPLGKVKGGKKLTIYDDEYYSFEGIPYAKPPLGELRFRAPQPIEPWSPAVIDGTHDFLVKPVQKNLLTGETDGSEDCLYLNVYSKQIKSDKPLPVIVWIYGGAFYMGEGTRTLHSPDYFMTEDVVLVTFNYRLCSLGFLQLSDPDLKVPGNAGLKDQVLALKWVKEYIKHFNGDSDNITVFGESAGGCSTHYMMITEQTRGLFHKAIPMSGCALNQWSCMPQADMAYRLAKFHGYDGEQNDAQILAFLKALPYEKLVQHNILTREDLRCGTLFPFGPTVEPYVGEDCVIPYKPLKMLKEAWSNDIPIMIGGTSYEGLFMYPRLKMFPQSMNTLVNDPERVLPVEIRQTRSADEIQELSKRIIQLHFGEDTPSDKCLHQFMDLYSYKIFWEGVHRSVLARLAYASKAPTYYYRFDFDSPDFNHYRTKFCGTDPIRGVAHADDLSYLFFSQYAWKLDRNSEEFKTIRRMVSMWTSFAKTSNPNCEQLADIHWKPLTQDDPWNVLNISNDLSIIELPERQKLEQWLSLFTKEQLFKPLSNHL